jgi:ankyrin repeat protein
MCAARYANDFTYQLIAAGAKINVQNNRYQTALDIAIEKGNIWARVRAMMPKSADMHDKFKQIEIALRDAGAKLGSELNLLLLDAILGNRLEEVHELLDGGASANAKHMNGATALHLAVISRFSAALQKLLGLPDFKGLNTRDDEGKTPLDLAYESNFPEFIEQLRANGAITGAEAAQLDPLLWDAVQSGNLERVKDLVARGADVNFQNKGKGMALLHLAAFVANKDFLLTQLVALDANEDLGLGLGNLNTKRQSWVDGLRELARNEDLHLVGPDLLDALARNEDLHPFLSPNANNDIVEILLSAPNINTEVKNSKGERAIEIASSENNMELVNLFRNFDSPVDENEPLFCKI